MSALPSKNLHVLQQARGQEPFQACTLNDHKGVRRTILAPHFMSSTLLPIAITMPQHANSCGPSVAALEAKGLGPVPWQEQFPTQALGRLLC